MVKGCAPCAAKAKKQRDQQRARAALAAKNGIPVKDYINALKNK